MKKINILASSKNSKKLEEGFWFTKDKTIALGNDDSNLDEVYEHLKECIDKSKDLSKFDGECIRVIISANGNYFDEGSESIRFRFNGCGSLGVFHNWECDKHKAFSPLVWKLWSFLHEQIGAAKVA
ncbi:hypothetical protein R7580_000785 [Campylobacter coli]|nr:hypothetical protein [Campylobacter coli]ELR0116522.1 hypothetical protein [Campylobacter coli]ELT2533032.1 hypothetical protein [Campylobacter coli]